MRTIKEKIEEIANKILPCNTLCRDDYCNINFKDCNLYKDICNALTEIATYQKEIDEEVRLKNCDDMTKAEYDRESAFAEWYHKNRNGTPTFSDAIEWARKEVINKACEWLDNYLMEIGYPDDWLRDSLNIKSGKERFRKAMEE